MEYLKTYRDQWLAQKQRMGSAWQTCMDGKWESYRESLQKLRGKNFIVINDFGWPISPDHYGKIVDRVAEKAGIRKIHPHMFRHTFVSILLSNPDIGVATVAAEAGHAQPSTTGFHPQPDERDALQEKNSRKMKRDVQTLRLHVSF